MEEEVSQICVVNVLHSGHTELPRQPQAQYQHKHTRALLSAELLCEAVGQSPAPRTNHCSASLWGWGGAARATRCISQGRAGRSSATHRLQQEQPARAQGSVIARGQSLAPPSRGCNDSSFLGATCLKFRALSSVLCCWKHGCTHTDRPASLPRAGSPPHPPLSFLIEGNDRRERASGQLWCLKTQLMSWQQMSPRQSALCSTPEKPDSFIWLPRGLSGLSSAAQGWERFLRDEGSSSGCYRRH